FYNVGEISHFQIKELPQMTPEVFHAVWEQGLNGNLYRFKMCGAGGGGFILGITFDWAQTQKKLSDYKLLKINW
ncbi:MAG: mevalonate kinase, partial [Saprospiraceae bacterium]